MKTGLNIAAALAIVMMTAPVMGRTVVVRRPRKTIVVHQVKVKGTSTTIDFDVDPEESKIFLDGKLRGEADDFDGFPGLLHVRPGTHRIRIVTPDGEVYKRRIRIRPGKRLQLNLKLD